MGDFNTLNWKVTSFDNMPDRPLMRTPTENRSYNCEQLEWKEYQWKVSKEEESVFETHRRYYDDLYETIRHGKPQYVTPESVRRYLWVFDKAQVAAECAAGTC